MSMEFVDACIVLRGDIDVEQAETALAWLQSQPCWGVDFSECDSVHPAVLQVFLCAGLPALRWPAQGTLALWLQSVMLCG
ncbi:MAG: STAS domain-containing protein [Sphingomonadaceae bacterium]